MTLRERLRTIGLGLTGKDLPVKEVVKEVDKKVEKFVTGTFLDFKQAGLSNYKTVSSKVLEANKGWVYRNTDAIASEVGAIEFELFTVKIVGNEIVYTKVDTHPALDALDRFNEFTDSSAGFYTLSTHKTLSGDAFLYVSGSGANVKGLYVLQPDKVELKFGKVAGSQVVIDNYKFEDTVDGKRVEVVYSPEEIIHFKTPNGRNPYRGYGRVEAAADDIDLDSLAIEANKKLYLRGLIANFVLTTEMKLTNEQLNQLHAEFKNSFQGIENAFKVPIFGSGLKPETVQLSNKDMQFIDHQEWLRDKITSIWGNNKAVIGVTDDVNRANAEATINLWKQSTIRTEMKSFCDTLNEFFIPRFGTNLVLGFKDPVGESDVEKIDKASRLKNSDLVSINEARELVGYEPVDGGDEMGFQRSERQSQAIAANLPKSLKHVNLDKVLRKSGAYKSIKVYNDAKAAALPMARKAVKKKKEVEAVREHPEFTNDRVWEFQSKQLSLVETQEEIFRNKCEQYINFLVDTALKNVPEEIALMQRKALLPEEELMTKAQIDFAPMLSDVATIMGQEALKLIEDDKPYIPMNLRPSIEANVNKFARSMIDTDKEKMIDIISKGLAEGKSVPAIKKDILNTFETYSKVQAERITRTEVIRASNMGAIDAWDSSGVVTGKQWLTAMDDRVDPLCSYMNGKIVDLKGRYFRKGETLEVGEAKTTFNYGSIKEPPLHVNCRCTLLPVLIGERGFNSAQYLKLKGLEADKEELLRKIDKRTKAYKELEAKDLELEDYVKELEEYLNA